VGDVIVATFFWTGSSNTITAVTDSLTTAPARTYVGDTYQLVEYVTAGGISMATYVATNAQGFPSGYNAPGGDSILAVAAHFSAPFTAGGVLISAYGWVNAVYAQTLGAHQSASGSGSSTTTADPGSITANAGALAYGVTLSNGLVGLNGPAGFSNILTQSNTSFKGDGEYAVEANAGSVDPQWTWFFTAPSTWLATVLALNPAPPSGVVFESNWSTATGRGATPVTDGGRWPNYWEFNNGSSDTLMSVVAGIGPSGLNALRVQQRGPTRAANIQLDNFLPQSTDYYVRLYMRNDDTSRAGDHVVTVDTWQYANLTYVRKASSASGWNIEMFVNGCAGDHYPVGNWSPAPDQAPDGNGVAQLLSPGQWYRFEYYVHFTDATHIQVHPRVYDASGALLFTDADFKQQDYGSTYWNGSNTWTFASYYAAGYAFCVDPTYTNKFGMGNNGQQGASDTGLYWYFANVQIRTDTWPGP
jgi:hypothetical protein